ncbi:MAG: type II secretion system major pseudopilin GspG [Gammaproteobacteria bacterium]|nr:type II secretion system major pseudopilin GspG [Gammaproteobacteria bacterium]
MNLTHSRPHAQQAGFTLIEIMVVVAILAILASVVIPRIMSEPDKARVVKAKQDIRVLESSLELYKLDNFTYPSTDQGLEALVTRPNDANNWKEGGYVKKLPKDPWQREYQYISPGEHGEIDVYSLGADGIPGGDKFAADIGNWDL